MPLIQLSKPCAPGARRWTAVRILAGLLVATRGVASPLSAQQATGAADTGRALTLSRSLTAARESSPALRAAREAVIAARARARQASALANPTLGFGRERTTGAGQTNAQDIVALEQPLDFGGQRAARGSAAGARVRIAEARLALAERDLTFETTRAYAMLAAAQRRAGLADESARTFAEAGRITTERLRAGDIAGYDARRLQLETARYVAQRADAMLALHGARVALASLMDVAPSSVAAALTSEQVGSIPSIDSLTATALASRADLQVMQHQVDVARADARLAAAERLPVPTVSAGYKQERIEDGRRATRSALHGFVAGFSVPLPLFDRRGGAIDAAAADTRVREAEADTLRRRIRAEVNATRAALEAVETQLAVLRPHLGESMRNALRAVQAAYAEGEITLSAWLDGVRAFQEAETTFALLEADAIIRRAALERAVGTPLFPSASR